MDYLASSNVPVYETVDEQRALWQRCAERGQPVLAVRDGARGFVVHYDLQHLNAELSPAALQGLRDRVRSRRPYPAAADPVSESEGVGGEAGTVSGELHAPTERDARDLASHISLFVLDRSNWR
jgi:hypothetical protein